MTWLRDVLAGRVTLTPGPADRHLLDTILNRWHSPVDGVREQLIDGFQELLEAEDPDLRAAAARFFVRRDVLAEVLRRDPEWAADHAVEIGESPGAFERLLGGLEALSVPVEPVLAEVAGRLPTPTVRTALIAALPLRAAELAPLLGPEPGTEILYGVSIASLLRCAREGRAEELLDGLVAGHDVDAAGDEGWTPLLAAASGGQSAIVELLLEAGADPNVAAGDWTPLHEAAQAGAADIVAMLLEAGADASAVTETSTGPATAADVARTIGRTDLVALLEPPPDPRAELVAMLERAPADGYEELRAALEAQPELAQPLLLEMAARNMDLRATVLIVRDRVPKDDLRQWIRDAVADELERLVYLVMV